MVQLLKQLKQLSVDLPVFVNTLPDMSAPLVSVSVQNTVRSNEEEAHLYLVNRAAWKHER